MQQIKILAVFAAMLGCGAAHAGDVYKYVDERGNTLYTDKPMPGAVLVSTASQRPPEVAQRSFAAQQTNNANQLAATGQRIAENQSNRRAAEQVAKDLEASRMERCKDARARYQTTINSRRLFREKNGEREYLDENQAAQARVDAHKEMEAVCGPQG